MGAHGIFSGGAVACLQGGKHGQVLGQALLQPARRVQLLQAGQPQNLAQIANHLGQPAVVGQGDEGLMDGVVGDVIVGDAPFAGALQQALVQGFERCHIGTAGLLRGLVGGAPFQQGDHGEDFVQVALCHLGHKAAPARFVAQQPLGHQHLQRLAQRCARNLQPLAQRSLVQKAAGRQCAAKNLLAQPRGDFIVQ